ncbi:MAG: PAS domain-containing protein [Rhodospirillaceae bacterium]|nr:PAS domain-containing protein [Rhodospirillaceae bacterium]
MPVPSQTFVVFDGTRHRVRPLDPAAFRQQLEFEEHRQLLDHWVAIRGSHPQPRRADFDPAAVQGILPHVGLMDVVPPGPRFRYRLLGTALERRFGRRVSGSFVDAVVDRAYADYLNGIYRACVTGRVPMFVAECSTFLSDYPLFRYRLLLPMSSDRDAIDMILYSTISDSDISFDRAQPTRQMRRPDPFRAYCLGD